MILVVMDQKQLIQPKDVIKIFGKIMRGKINLLRDQKKGGQQVGLLLHHKGRINKHIQIYHIV